ncbi:hypothetical protein [Halorhabdus amylolytica]|uniref:hypothetical protein n=1 Tax=Halorhabdus amylolytica TaxID=2559573 RepID=UPI0010AA229D|nr:hypothetical protein [Halorhabdus amylolytica]
MGEPAGFHAEKTIVDQSAIDGALDSMAELYESTGQENSVASGMVETLREHNADLDQVDEVLDGRRRDPSASCKE